MESWSADKEMEFIYRILERYSQQEVLVTFGERTLAKFNLEQLEKLKFSFQIIYLVNSPSQMNQA